MSSANDDLRPWTRRQWSVAVMTIVLAQVGLIVVFGEREVKPRTATSVAGACFKLVSWPREFAELTRELGVVDPMVFAVPSEQGFSGGAWELAQDIPAPRLGWGEGRRWLGGDSNWFGRWSNGVPAGLIGPRPRQARPVPADTRVQVRPLSVARVTRLDMDGRLLHRGVLAVPTLPSIQHTNLLNATQVQVSVEPDGWVFSAVVLRSSGWEVADRQALDLVRQVRFTPTSSLLRPGAERQWGWIRFRWYTTRPESSLSTRPGPTGA